MRERALTEADRPVISFTLNARNQRLCSWCGPLYVAGILIGLCLIAGFIPPPRASLTAGQVVARYRSNTTGIRIGLFIAITCTALYAPFAALISTQMLRIEGRRRPFLAYVQLANGAIGVAILQDPGETPVFPRWVAYYNFWVAFAFIPTGFVGFFHSGPFAWHGLISFWLAVAVYAGWFIVMTIALRRAINDEVVGQARHV